MEESSESVPGWYGKIPSLGDFAFRRLPESFRQRWDDWLQAGIARSRTDLGEGWTDAYMTSPAWRFLLMPGACGMEGWSGLMVPSVDRVGRQFPLTLAAQFPAHGRSAIATFRSDMWYDALEEVGLGALAPERTLDDLERDLERFDLDYPPQESAPWTLESVADWWLDPADTALTLAVAGNASVAQLLTVSALDPFFRAGAGRSLWWCYGPSGETRLRAWRGLPPASAFRSLLTGS